VESKNGHWCPQGGAPGKRKLKTVRPKKNGKITIIDRRQKKEREVKWEVSPRVGGGKGKKEKRAQRQRFRLRTRRVSDIKGEPGTI